MILPVAVCSIVQQQSQYVYVTVVTGQGQGCVLLRQQSTFEMVILSLV